MSEYRVILDAARLAIEDLFEGDPGPHSIKEIARRVPCSVGTAGAVLGQLASEGLVARDARGYRRPDVPFADEALAERVLYALVRAHGAATRDEVAQAVGASRIPVARALRLLEAAGGARRVLNGLAPLGWVITPVGREALL